MKWSREMINYLRENNNKKRSELIKDYKNIFGVELTEKSINAKRQVLGLKKTKSAQERNINIFCEGIANPDKCYNCPYSDCIANDNKMTVIPITELVEFFQICRELGV